ncbi:type II secretion system protein N [Enterobacteriaceae bacterium 4M9]|nr:type II secretion system protein N [Enterobacteriaceae bacterium 4M9]
MSKAWRYGALCLLLYLLALAFTAPARLVARLLPEHISTSGVTGTIWAGQFLNLRWKNISSGDVSWRWGWYNGLPGVYVMAQGGPVQGNAHIGWLGSWRVSDARLKAEAQPLLALSGVMLPLEAQGELTLTLTTLRITPAACLALEARLDWHEAQLGALGQRLALGEPQLDMRCEGQRIKGVLRQAQAPLPFSAQGSLDYGGEYRVSGQSGPTDALPAPWPQMINSVTQPAPDGQRIMEVSGKWTLHRR